MIFYQKKSCRAGDRDTCSFHNTSTALIFNPCEGLRIGNVPHEYDCTKYYTCINEIPQLQQCGSGQIFNPDLNQCATGSC